MVTGSNSLFGRTNLNKIKTLNSICCRGLFLDQISYYIPSPSCSDCRLSSSNLGSVGAGKLVRSSPNMKVTYKALLHGEGEAAIGMLTATVENLL